MEVNLLVQANFGQLTASLGQYEPRTMMLSIIAGGCTCQWEKQWRTLSALTVTHASPVVISK